MAGATDGVIEVSGFDVLTPTEAAELLQPVCAAADWVAAIVAGRPYASLPAVIDASDAAVAELPWTGVIEALAAHPRIGERPAGQGRDASWSRSEQAAVAHRPADVEAALVAANLAYEQRFGHVLLVCATGLSAPEVLRRAEDRLGNTADSERAVVRGELAAIARLRLARVLR